MRRPLGAVERAGEREARKKLDREGERQREGESKVFDRKVKSGRSIRWDTYESPKTVHILSGEFLTIYLQEPLKTNGFTKLDVIE